MNNRRRFNGANPAARTAWLAIHTGLATLAASVCANAQTLPAIWVPPAGARPEELRAIPRVDEPRLRLGAGGHISAMLLARGGFLPTGLGAYLRIGVQFSDDFALEVQASTATLLITGYGRMNLYAEYTHDNWASFAVGPLVGAAIAYSIGGYSGIGILGASYRSGFHFARGRHRQGGRTAWTAGFELDVATTFMLGSYWRWGDLAGAAAFFIGVQRD